MADMGWGLWHLGIMLLYISFCWVVGAAAASRNRSVFSYVMVSLFVTPVVAYVILLIAAGGESGLRPARGHAIAAVLLFLVAVVSIGGGLWLQEIGERPPTPQVSATGEKKPGSRTPAEKTQARTQTARVEHRHGSVSQQAGPQGPSPRFRAASEKLRKIEVAIVASEDLEVTIWADDQKLSEGLMRRGERRKIIGEAKVILWVSNAGALLATVNGETQPALGAAGEKKYVTFSRSPI